MPFPIPDLTALGQIVKLFVAFLGAYLFAVWVSMIIWTYRDIHSRSRDIFAQILAVALVVVFNIAGLLLYFILRPRETLAEKYERELAEEAMLQDIEERQVCPVCHHKVAADYLVCPNCHTKLHKKCDNCGRILNLKWNVCPYCGEPQSVPTGPRLAPEAPPPPARTRRGEPVLRPVAAAPALIRSSIERAPVNATPVATSGATPPKDGHTAAPSPVPSSAEPNTAGVTPSAEASQ